MSERPSSWMCIECTAPNEGDWTLCEEVTCEECNTTFPVVATHNAGCDVVAAYIEHSEGTHR